MFKKPIIPIERASESTINTLIEAGILYVSDNELKCIEPEQASTGRKE